MLLLLQITILYIFDYCRVCRPEWLELVVSGIQQERTEFESNRMMDKLSHWTSPWFSAILLGPSKNEYWATCMIDMTDFWNKYDCYDQWTKRNSVAVHYLHVFQLVLSCSGFWFYFFLNSVTLAAWTRICVVIKEGKWRCLNTYPPSEPWNKILRSALIQILVCNLRLPVRLFPKVATFW